MSDPRTQPIADDLVLGTKIRKFACGYSLGTLGKVLIFRQKSDVIFFNIERFFGKYHGPKRLIFF